MSRSITEKKKKKKKKKGGIQQAETDRGVDGLFIRKERELLGCVQGRRPINSFVEALSPLSVAHFSQSNNKALVPLKINPGPQLSRNTRRSQSTVKTASIITCL